MTKNIWSLALDSTSPFSMKSQTNFLEFIREQIDARISNVRYSVDLDKCREFIVDDVIEGKDE